MVTQSCDHLQHLRQIFPNQRLVRPGQAQAAQVFPENKVAAALVTSASFVRGSGVPVSDYCLCPAQLSGPGEARVSDVDVRKLRGSHATKLVTFSAGMIEKKVF